MEFQSSRSAMEMEVRTSTATHILDGISEQHVSKGNGSQNINSNSHTGWNFRAAGQEWKWTSEHQQQLTDWMEFQSSMSAMEIRISTATHRLDGISEQHVSNGNGGQNINSNSQTGWNFRAACQQWKWRSEHQQQLTYWMEFQSSMSAMEMEVRTSTATHSLDGTSEQLVSNGNEGQNINSNSQTGWNFRAACQQWKWRSEHQQQLTAWMELQSSLSAMEMEVITSTATHSLDGISEQHVSNGNGGQNINSNSQPGWNFRAACQQWKCRSEHQQQFTTWMEFQSSMSAMEMEVRPSTATHSLDGISEQHVSNGNGGQNINSNSQPGWNFRAACQQWRSEHQQQLTTWMEFQSSMSAMEVRTSTATHNLDGISEQHVSKGNGGQTINSNSQPGWNFRAACQQWKWRSEHQQQLTTWMEFQSSMSAMEMEVRTSTATQNLDGISEQHVSNGNGGQNINSNSQPGWNFRAACQQGRWRSEHQQQLTTWMEFQSSMSAREMEVRTSTATHNLDGISEQHVSKGNGGQNINSNSQPGWNFRAACQQGKWRSEHQ